MKKFLLLCSALGVVGFVAGHATAPRSTPGGTATGAPHPSAGQPVLPAVSATPPAGADPGADAKKTAATLNSAANLENLFASLVAWAARDPHAALAFALENLKWRRQEQAVGLILGEWTRHDPQGAWDWAVANGSLQYVDAVLSELGKTDGTLAWQFATAHAARHPAAARATYVGALRGMTYAGDYETAARRLAADTVLDPGARTAIASLLIASEWGLNDPEKAVAWAGGLAKDDPIRNRVLAELGAAWSAVNPSAAAEFGLRLEAGEARQEIVTRAVDNWIDRNPSSVGEFLARVSPHADFDRALERLATHPAILRSSPADALSWAGRIGDRELQTQALTRVFSDWLQKDSVTATACLETSLPAALGEEVLARVRNGDVDSSGAD